MASSSTPTSRSSSRRRRRRFSHSSHDIRPILKDPLPRPVEHQEHKDNMVHKNEYYDVSSKHNDKVQRVQIEPERVGWARISDLVRQKDKDKVEDVKEDIDTLLVFAGLFSAVITAFFIESYKSLRQQPEDTTAEALLHISVQLASLTLNGNFINSTLPSFTPSSFKSPRFSVQINTLWSLSLVLALITASLGILVKQWLHEFMARDTQNPHEEVKIQFYRNHGLYKWQVYEIAAFLPLLLQLALLLFFVGLSLFLHELNPVVGWIATSVMVMWLTVFFLATILPAFSAQCPYKTPMLKVPLARVRMSLQAITLRLIETLAESIVFCFRSDGWVKRCADRLRQRSRRWYDRMVALEETEVRTDSSLDWPAIVCAQDVLRGVNIDEAVVYCFREDPVYHTIYQFAHFVEQQRADLGLFPDVLGDAKEQARNAFSVVIGNHRSLIREDGESLFRWVFQPLSRGLTFALTDSYVPGQNMPISSTSLPLFIRLIQTGPRFAALAILIMYFIRARTMIQHPHEWDHLFPILSDTESYNLGDQFVFNLIAATTALIHSLWNQPQPESDIEDVHNCIVEIREDAAESDPVITLDPIAFMYAFARVLYGLTPEAVVQKHQESLHGVMDKLMEIVDDSSISLHTRSQRDCVQALIDFFKSNRLGSTRFVSKLQRL